MIAREEYLKKLRLFKNKQLIKVVTGIRRCGKSTLLKAFAEELNGGEFSKNPDPRCNIIFINFEDLQNEHLLNYRAAYDYIYSKLTPDKMNYIFLDEIQQVENFQKAVDSLFILDNTDIYITGSNSKLLSGELATLLTGRYAEIKMLPLSFKEFFSACGKDVQAAFAEYLAYGGMPYTVALQGGEAKNIYLQGIYSTIMAGDILHRYPTADINVLEGIFRFLLHSAGSLISPHKIAESLTSSGRKTTYNTVEKYIGYLKECFLIYEAARYDIKGKQHLKTLSKYYCVDTGIRNIMLANKASNIGHVLESVVYFELLRRYRRVSVGKMDTGEVDFVAEGDGGLHYYQVCATLADDNKRAAELSPFAKINDNYPKTLITADSFGLGDENGVQIVNIFDFLLN